MTSLLTFMQLHDHSANLRGRLPCRFVTSKRNYVSVHAANEIVEGETERESHLIAINSFLEANLKHQVTYTTQQQVHVLSRKTSQNEVVLQPENSVSYQFNTQTTWKEITFKSLQFSKENPYFLLKTAIQLKE